MKDPQVLFSSRNYSGAHVLSDAYAAARAHARSALPHTLSEQEEVCLNRQLTRNLLDAHDSGVRDPDALRRAALQGVLA